MDMKKNLGLLIVFLSIVCAQAEVRVFVQDSNGVATVNYECTAGEIVRAFALDVSVDRGQIVGISDFFRGVSTPEATGYGIFPASLRDHISVGSGTNVNWNVSDYTPLASVADLPGGTSSGLNSTGVTLEFGGLWDPTVPSAIPGPTGMLCALKLSQGAKVSVGANAGRGGVVSAIPGSVITAMFTGALVGPAITSATLENGIMNILFKGGELETANSPYGQWSGTGDASGNFTEPLGTNQMKFYRVRSP
jgi:hypothetical protein